MPLLKTYLVEDSPVIRDSLIDTLEELGDVQVLGWAAGETAAVGWLADPANLPALVIVDLFLEQGSGLGVLRAASGQARGIDAPHLVVLSNYATAEVRARCLALGAERVFDKSGDIEDLLGYCRALAGAQRLN